MSESIQVHQSAIDPTVNVKDFNKVLNDVRLLKKNDNYDFIFRHECMKDMELTPQGLLQTFIFGYQKLHKILEENSVFQALPQEIRLELIAGDKTMVCNQTKELLYAAAMDDVSERESYVTAFKKNKRFH